MNQSRVGRVVEAGRVIAGSLLGASLLIPVGCSSADADYSSPAASRASQDANTPSTSYPQPSATAGASNSSPAAGANLGIQAPSAEETAPTDPAPDVTPKTNGFVVTAHDPQSTFAADVDTASYDIFRGAASYVKERMLSTMTFIAKDMKIQVEFNPAHVFAYRLLGYEDRAIADNDFRNDVIDAGEVGAGHRVTALYELALTRDSVPDVGAAAALQDGAAFSDRLEVDPGALALVKVRYKERDASETDAAREVSQSLLPSELIAAASGADDDFAWAMAVASFSEILKKSPFAAASSLDTIARILTRPSFAADPDRSEFVTLFGQVRPLLVP